MLQANKKTLLNIGLVALVLGSLFAICYLPAMQMAAVHNPTSKFSHFTETDKCCATQSSHHTLTALGIPASPINLESLFILLGLNLMFLIGAEASLTVKKFLNAKLLHARRFILRLFDYLVLFFSRGVLHPKLYNA